MDEIEVKEIDEVADTSIQAPFIDIFEKKLREVPEYTKVLEFAEKYGDAHRHIVQEMLMSPLVPLKKFYIMFIKYVVDVQMKIHPGFIKYMIANEEELRTLAVKVINTINKVIGDKDQINVVSNDSRDPADAAEKVKTKTSKISALEVALEDEEYEETIGTSLGLRLILATSEGDCKENVVLVSDLQNSEVMKNETEFSPGQLALWWLIIDEAILNNGVVDDSYIMSIAHVVNSSLTQKTTNEFLCQLRSQGWITWGDEEIRLTPRTITEMEPYLSTKHGGILSKCSLCAHFIVLPQYTVVCDGCQNKLHYHCYKRSLFISGGDVAPCSVSGCNAKLVKDKIEEVIETKVEEAGQRDVVHAKLPPKTEKIEKVFFHQAESIELEDDVDVGQNG